MNMKDLQTSASQAANLLGSLANEKRLLLLCQLVEGEKSVGALAEALESLLTDPDRTRALGERGRIAVHERFSIDRMAEDMLSIYNSLVGSET